MKQNKKQAFTLVELIVVITILAILGTIAFISLQGYSTQSRDSVRISDISGMKTSLELFHLDAGKYPEPTVGVDITYSGAVVWNQGTFGKTTFKNVEKLNKIPTDPLVDKEYTYSVTANRNEYEISGILETDILSKINILDNSYAGEKQATALVTGNYNGQMTKSLSGTTCDILSIPTIITNDTEASTDLVDITTNESFVFNGYKNLPNSFRKSKFKSDGGFAFQPTKLVAYSDTGSCTALSDSEDYSARVELINGLQESYSGTILKSSPKIKRILALQIDTNTPNSEVKLFATNFVNNNFAGELEIVNSADGICGSDDGLDLISSPINLCSDGTSTIVVDNGVGNTYTWTCEGLNGGLSPSCSANHVVSENGVCGGDNGLNLASIPTNLCTSGGLTSVIDNGTGSTYNWNCNGLYGGDDVSCSANHTIFMPASLTECSASGQIGLNSTSYGVCNTNDIIVCNGTGNGYIISACNVGTYNSGTGSSSYGGYFQFGRNSASSWSNGSYLYDYDWTSPGGVDGGSANDWGVTESVKTSAIFSNVSSANKTKMKGPCLSGYHIPTFKEWFDLYSAGGWGEDGTAMSNYLKLPKGGFRNGSSSYSSIGSSARYWSSSPAIDKGYNMYFTSSQITSNSRDRRNNGFSIRCFKD